jgi:hypothetical protein
MSALSLINVTYVYMGVALYSIKYKTNIEYLILKGDHFLNKIIINNLKQFFLVSFFFIIIISFTFWI